MFENLGKLPLFILNKEIIMIGNFFENLDLIQSEIGSWVKLSGSNDKTKLNRPFNINDYYKIVSVNSSKLMLKLFGCNSLIEIECFDCNQYFEILSDDELSQIACNS